MGGAEFGGCQGGEAERREEEGWWWDTELTEEEGGEEVEAGVAEWEPVQAIGIAAEERETTKQPGV